MKELDKTLINRIEKSSYKDLFLVENQELIAKIWNEGKNENVLLSVLEVDSISDLTKLKISELLFHYKVDVSEKYHQTLANSYASCLSLTSFENENSIELNANSWGFLYDEDDIGILGSKFLVFKEASLMPLKKLLNNSSKVEYEGSKSAMIGNSYQYRIKDFAAFYISKIKDIPIMFYQDFEKRDAEIERLKEILENE